jgi:hypothetical protein
LRLRYGFPRQYALTRCRTVRLPRRRGAALRFGVAISCFLPCASSRRPSIRGGPGDLKPHLDAGDSRQQPAR